MTKQQINDPSKGKYFSQILHMADDDLGPYEMRLLVHYTRVAGASGKCWEGIRATARITRMSVGMVTKTRNQLVTLGYIKVKHRDEDTCVIVIVDRMAENVARYAHESTESNEDEFDAPSGLKRSPGEQGVHETRQGVHVVNTSELEGVHVVNERIIEPKEQEPKKKIKESLRASDDAARKTVPDNWTVADEAEDYLPLKETKAQKTARAQKSETRLKSATTPPPPNGAAAPSPKRKQSPLQAENAANAEALGKAWGVPPAPSDYGLYIKRVQRLAESGITQDRYQRFCDWVKSDAGDFASKLTVAHITEGGRISKFLQWDADQTAKLDEQRAAEERYHTMHRERYPHLYQQDTSKPASPEQIAALKARRLEIARGFKS